MFWHLYKYRLKVLITNKELLFWLGLFPIILGTLFQMTFSDIAEKTETISELKIAIVAEEDSEMHSEELAKQDEAFSTFIATMSERGYFEIEYTDYNSAVEDIDNGEIDGALVLSGMSPKGMEMSLLFGASGMNQTILKNIINTYKHGATVIADAVANNPENLEQVIAELYSEDSVNEDLSFGEKNMNTYNQYFFALFSMTCMFGASFSMFNTVHSQADQSAVAVRRLASPTKKMMMVVSEFVATVTVMEMLFAILVLYLVGVLGVDLGTRYDLIALASFVSILLGVSLGYFLGVLLKCKQSVKEGITMALILLLNFLAGLMMGNMKFIIEKSCPIINRINPAALISDCFYAICAYSDTTMYFRSIISISIWAVVLAAGSIIVLRREKYANL